MNQITGARTSSRFTDKQGQYLAFIAAYTLVNGRPPAETDMQRFFGTTPPSVHQMVLTLEKAGLITRTPRAEDTPFRSPARRFRDFRYATQDSWCFLLRSLCLKPRF